MHFIFSFDPQFLTLGNQSDAVRLSESYMDNLQRMTTNLQKHTSAGDDDEVRCTHLRIIASRAHVAHDLLSICLSGRVQRFHHHQHDMPRDQKHNDGAWEGRGRGGVFLRMHAVADVAPSKTVTLVVQAPRKLRACRVTRPHASAGSRLFFHSSPSHCPAALHRPGER